ncbi:hypothetical protein HC928_23995 [bacterium]|nr:hypothetical protein [bacterium]
MRGSFQGSPGLPLILGVVGLALHELWKKRTQLVEEPVGAEDQLLGHILILSGVAFFPFYRSAVWSQSLIWLIVLIGIACSSWGLGFFRKHTVPALLMALSVYPRPGETTPFAVGTGDSLPSTRSLHGLGGQLNAEGNRSNG